MRWERSQGSSVCSYSMNADRRHPRQFATPVEIEKDGSMNRRTGPTFLITGVRNFSLVAGDKC